MKSSEIRSSFVQYFADRGHRPVGSSPLVPHGDPTLLFTNAGMVQFKDVFLGREKRDYRRAVSVQKCLRVSGKHNDLENVGPSPRHHTFFEMLGNFSFGDYFKADAIAFGWELVTKVWGLPAARLSATVFENDDEAFELWRKVSGLPAERIHRCGAKDNFWAMGETGPCGPCSEIFVDLHPELPEVGWEEGTDSGRYLEIWNLVFMQFDRDAQGTLVPLPNPSIDTGAGLERVTAVLDGVLSNYDTDLFQPILRATAALASTEYGRDAEKDVSMRVIADHLRAVTFLLGDGVIPSNEGRGYVLRRILRRAVRHGMRLGFEEPFLTRLVPIVREVMGGAYAELAETEKASMETVRAEEEKFLATVATGARQVQEAIEERRRAGESTLPGETLFRLYDTYGFPLELLREIAEEERFRVDDAGFTEALDRQRQRSRSATGETQKRMQALQAAVAEGGEAAATEFRGYGELELPTRVERVVIAGEAMPRLGAKLGVGEEGVVVLAATPFYSESGGQIGDRGRLDWPGGRAEVTDTQKSPSGLVYHFVRVVAGELETGAAVTATVDEDRRRATERNHTATHLLHAALRQVLGKTVRQAGSLVAPDRLRFDFTWPQPVSVEERRQIEDLVNRWVWNAVPVAIRVTSYKEAVGMGAMALFGEKYGDEVRTVQVPGFSLELCGGCHVRNTGEIGSLVIVAERGIASGVRRIEALTGSGAVAHWRERQAWLEAAEAVLGAPGERLAEEIAAVRGRVKELEGEVGKLRIQLVTGGAGKTDGGASADTREVAGVQVMAKEIPSAEGADLRSLADVLRQKLGTGVVALGTRGEGKVNLLIAVTDDLVGKLDAGALVREAAVHVGGRGGGKRDFAQAGGKDPAGLDAALAAVPELVGKALGG